MTEQPKIYAIGDLHLSFFKKKSMDIFGAEWCGHAQKIYDNWNKTIKPCDCVLLCGDTSWAVNLEELKPDMDFLQSLPGKKVIVKGNHDYWWGTLTVMNAHFDISFLKNNFVSFGDYAICGTRGWLCPNDEAFTPHDNKIYNRELNRLRLSLDSAVSAGYKKIVVMLHYPPVAALTDEAFKETSGFIEIIESYPAEKVVYGHLHSVSRADGLRCDYRNGIEYHVVSSNHLDFMPKKITELSQPAE